MCVCVCIAKTRITAHSCSFCSLSVEWRYDSYIDFVDVMRKTDVEYNWFLSPEKRRRVACRRIKGTMGGEGGKDVGDRATFNCVCKFEDP